MARIRILELPAVHGKDEMTTPFSIIIDQVELDGPLNWFGDPVRRRGAFTQDQADKIAADMGAVSAILVLGTLDLA